MNPKQHTKESGKDDLSMSRSLSSETRSMLVLVGRCAADSNMSLENPLVDRPTQLICIFDIYLLTDKQTNAKDIAGQSAKTPSQF